jgi:hypothetical protein
MKIKNGRFGSGVPDANWVTPERVLEFGSYHAIVACVAAGSGIALVPHSVVQALHAERDVSILPHRFSLHMPRRFLSGPQNIVLLLSTPYVANWLRRTSANTSRRFVRSVQRLQPGLDLGATRLHKRREREPSSKEVQSFVSGKSGSVEGSVRLLGRPA